MSAGSAEKPHFPLLVSFRKFLKIPIKSRSAVRIYDEARGGESVTEQEFEQAVARIRDGDKGGLKDIYLAYVKFIYAVIYEILHNKENTEDVTSEFFIKLWDVAERYEPGHGHRGYLATIARNMAIDYVRKRRREVLLADPDTGMPSYAQGASDAAVYVARSATAAGVRAENSGAGAYGGREAEGRTGTSGGWGTDSGAPPGVSAGMPASPVEEEVVGNMTLEEALAVLKDGERQIINMKILGDMTFQEISDTLHMPMGTVTWKYRNAIGKLRRCGYGQGSEKRI